MSYATELAEGRAHLRNAFDILNSAKRECHDGICVWHRLSPAELSEAQCCLIVPRDILAGESAVAEVVPEGTLKALRHYYDLHHSRESAPNDAWSVAHARAREILEAAGEKGAAAT